MAWLDGNKTYLVALVTVVWGLVGYWMGDLSMADASGLVLGGSGLGALRHGVAKGGQQ